MMKNAFFDFALNKASRLLGNKRRLLGMLAGLGVKLKTVNWNEVRGADIRTKFLVIGRLMKAYALGHYREIPWKSLLLITGAILYFIMPLDLIPDIMPAVGLTDDVGILIAIYEALNAEVDKFLSWEKTHLSK